VKQEFARPGARVEIEMTVEAVRHRVHATVTKTPFYNPKQKTMVPV
jgi:glycine cleavage system aminomethyltransferase T